MSTAKLVHTSIRIDDEESVVHVININKDPRLRMCLSFEVTQAEDVWICPGRMKTPRGILYISKNPNSTFFAGFMSIRLNFTYQDGVAIPVPTLFWLFSL